MANKIIITTSKEDNNVSLSFEGEAPNIPDFITTLFTAVLGAVKQIPDTPEVKEEVYDMINIAASNLLEQYAPEIEMRPNLTVDAIVEAENQLLMKDKEGKYLQTAEQAGQAEPTKEQ